MSQLTDQQKVQWISAQPPEFRSDLQKLNMIMMMEMRELQVSKKKA